MRPQYSVDIPQYEIGTFNMILRISVLIWIVLFTVFAWSEPDTVKIKPAEIFEGLPRLEPSLSPQPVMESLSPTSDTQSGSAELEIITSPVPPVQNDQPSSAPLKETFVLDNKTLEEYIKSHREPYVEAKQPTPIPDIEKLREQLHATPSPTPASGIVSFSIPVSVEKMNDKWNQLEADFVIDYQMKRLYSSLSLKGMDDNSEDVTVLKNSPSIESFPVKKGRYRITGTFWIPEAPDLEIKAVMGAVIVNNRMRYTMILDRDTEQDILYEMGLKNAEKLKAFEDKSQGVIKQPEGL
jgi:hypothetical protein